MKRNKFLIIFLLISKFLFAQNNFISNFGFENGSSTPRCENGDYFSSTPIENDIYDWKIAKNGDYKYSSPDWMDYNCGSKYCCLQYANRWVYLEA